MINAIYFLSELLFTYVKCWMSFELIAVLSEHKVEKKSENIVKIISSLGASVLYVYNSTIISTLFSSVMMILVVFILVIISGIIYRCRPSYRFSIIYLGWLSLTMLDFFIQTLSCKILVGLGKEPDLLLKIGYARSIYMIVSAILSLWIAHKIIEWLKDARIFQYRKWLFSALVPLTIAMIYFQNIYLLEMPETLMNSWWIVILGTILGTLLLGAQSLRRREAEERRLQQLKWDMLEENYNALLQIYEEKAILLHDTKNHFQVIQEMVTADQKEELIQYIKEITGKMHGYRNHDYVNHKLMNMILGMKFSDAEDAGIHVEFVFDDMSEMQLKQVELCAILTNLLDNAIEANLKVSNIYDRWMKICCIRKHQMMVLTISNPIGKGGVNQSDGEFLTTKENEKIHGFGMRSIKRVVDKYEGHMRVDTEGGIFIVTIYLHAFAPFEVYN